MRGIYDCECDSFEMIEEQNAFSMNEGIPGPGVPAGGSAGQILQKRSQEDYDTEWVTPDGYVPAGGSAGQILKKSSAEDYDTEWDSLDAGDVSFDSSLTYPTGTVGQELSSQRNTLNHMENGVNENMTAGNAMQLDSSVYAEDQVPYLFRQTGGGVNAGTREIDTIVGGTVAWNQLVNSGMISVTVPNGHKYLSRINSVVSIGTSTGTGISINDATKDNVFDLTQMFGTAIADRAYALEQATAGSGIAWLKSMGFFTKDYYAYDAGSLQSVKVGSHKTYDADNNVIGSYPLDTTKEWRGILKLDANNKVYADGDIYPPSGEAQRRYGIVNLGLLTYHRYGQNNDLYYTDLPYQSKPNNKNAIMSSKYLVAPSGTGSDLYSVDKIYTIAGIFQTTNQYRLTIHDSSAIEEDAFKAAMSGVYLAYELATPTSESALPYQTPQICAADGTEEYTDYAVAAGTRDVAVPVGHLTKYPEDLRAKIEGLPWDLSMIAPIENGTTASKAYSQGQYFLHNDLFCKALTSIASGATFTLNTNYAVTTVAAELFAAINS